MDDQITQVLNLCEITAVRCLGKLLKLLLATWFPTFLIAPVAASRATSLLDEASKRIRTNGVITGETNSHEHAAQFSEIETRAVYGWPVMKSVFFGMMKSDLDIQVLALSLQGKRKRS